MIKKNLRTFPKILLILSAILIIGLFIFMLPSLKSIAMPFIIAIIFSYILHPIIIFFDKKNVSRKISIITTFILFLLIVVLFCFYIAPIILASIKDFTSSIPLLSDNIKNNVNYLIKFIEKSNWPDDIKNTLLYEINTLFINIYTNIFSSIKKVIINLLTNISYIIDIFLGIIISYYFLLDSDKFRNLIISLAPLKWQGDFKTLWHSISKVLSNFVQGQILTSIIVGFLEFISLLILGIKYPLLLAIIGTLLNIIPYFGPLIGFIPAGIISLTHSSSKVIWVAIVFIIIQQLENIYISPKILENKLGLHPVMTIFLVILGGELFGIWGMIFFVPLYAIIQVLINFTLAKIY